MVDNKGVQKKEQMKIVLLGDANVGKTTIINQFTTGKVGQGATVGSEFQRKDLIVG